MNAAPFPALPAKLPFTGVLAAVTILAVLLPAVLLPASAAPSEADRGAKRHAERVHRGELSFRVHCASCHGAGATGDGPMAEVLKIRPPDLTTLRQRNGGIFPSEDVYRKIDGREEVASHGSRLMPIWGSSFQTRGLDRSEQKEVRQRILDLVTYLESIQKTETR
jgi:Cytochrome c